MTNFRNKGNTPYIPEILNQDRWLDPCGPRQEEGEKRFTSDVGESCVKRQKLETPNRYGKEESLYGRIRTTLLFEDE